MTAAAPAALGGQNVAAFLDMLAVSEGTDIPRQPTKNRGYDVMVGGALLSSLADHPRTVVSLKKRDGSPVMNQITGKPLQSSAAGRYQFLRATWDDLAKRCSLTDFGPVSQDRAAVALLQQCGAYPLIRLGKFTEAVQAARKIWASLPGAGYGQPEHSIEKLSAAYIAAGGTLQ